MRAGLDAPAAPPSVVELERTRAYLDRQSRIALAVWVRHEHETPTGPAFDHHLMLGIPDDEYDRGDLRALDAGLEAEASLPGWVDLCPLSEVERLRLFGLVVWERNGDAPAGLDPLAFRFVYEAPEIPPDARASVAAAAERLPCVVGVDIYVSRLMKGDVEVDVGTHVSVRWDDALGGPADVVHAMGDAVRDTVPLSGSSFGVGLAGAKLDHPHATLFELEEAR